MTALRSVPLIVTALVAGAGLAPVAQAATHPTRHPRHGVHAPSGARARAIDRERARRNPTRNITVRDPAGCATRIGSRACRTSSIDALDASRAAEGLGAYRLPRTFARLTPDEQIFVLTDLDRVAAGLVPYDGLSPRLDAVAARGMRADTDPTMPVAGTLGWGANWAGAFPDAMLAYQAWMYDDGFGSGNLACATRGSSGCWGHRHNILTDTGSVAWSLGVAAGRDARGQRSYATIASAPAPGHGRLRLTYTWADAVAAGAGR